MILDEKVISKLFEYLENIKGGLLELNKRLGAGLDLGEGLVDLLFLDLENGLRCYEDLSLMEGDTKRMILAMLRQIDPNMASREGFTIRDWLAKLEGERVL